MLPSINSIYSVNGYIGDTPINFLVDSGAALSVMHYNLVRDMQFKPTSHCVVGANGSPLDIVGQVMVTVTLGTFVSLQPYSRLFIGGRFYEEPCGCFRL